MTKRKYAVLKKPTANVATKTSTAQQAMLLRDSVIDPELRAQMK